MGLTNLIEILIKGRDEASGPINDVSRNLNDRLTDLGGKMSSVGMQMSMISVPMAAAMGMMVNQTMLFNETMTNTGAVLGKTQEEMAGLSAEILAIGENSRAGPQAVAEAFYDVAGGVTDAANHIPILTAAIATAEAGSANLQETTGGLIAVMNAYGLEAQEVTHVSDVFTRTVGMGVGTMDQFVAAMGPIAGIAGQVGVNFEQMGAMMGFMTQRGFTASASATRIQSAITALIKPNTELAAAFQEMGVESGEALIRQYGLAGALQQLNTHVGGSVDQMGKMLGTVEALGAATALAGEEFTAFEQTFVGGVEGATAAAQAIQMESAAYQFDVLKAQISALGIEIGNQLLPLISKLIKHVQPVISAISNWVRANPSLVQGIALVGAAIAASGPTLLVMGQSLQFIGFLMGTLSGSILPVIAVLGGLYYAWQENFLGIQQVVQPVIDFIRSGLQTVVDILEGVKETIDEIGIGRVLREIFSGDGLKAETLQNLFSNLVENGIGMTSAGGLVGGLSMLVETFGSVVTFIQANVIPVFTFLLGTLGSAWEVIGPALGRVADWVLNTALPFIVAAFRDFAGFIQTLVIPALMQFADWVTKDALPLVVNFIETTVRPAFERFIASLADFWFDIQPGLTALFDWFVNDALPTIVNFIETVVVPIVGLFLDQLITIWEKISPALSYMFNWFMMEGLPMITDFINITVIPIIQALINIISGIWNAVKPVMDMLTTGIISTFNQIIDIIDRTIGKINEFMGTWTGIGDNGNAILGSVRSGENDWGDVAGATWNAIGQEFHLPGFASGGWTGSGPADEVAGNVHYQEYVVPQDGALVLKGGGESTVINVELPPEALRNLEAAREMGSVFGEQIKQKLRRNG